MNQTAQTPGLRGNQSMEVFRLIASILVIFAHVPFPGTVGPVLNCFARCSVPGFFAISGFFAYGASSKKLEKRIWNLAKLTAVAFGLELFYNCVLIELEGGSSIGYLRAMIPNAYEIANFVLLNVNFLRDTFWYLPAALEAMIGLWLYVRFREEEGQVNYGAFYIVGFCLFAVTLVLSTMGTGARNPGSIFQFRNGLFFGIPLMAMGLFLGQHWQRIVEKFALTNGKLAVLVVLCLGLSLTEWFGFGICDVMVGSVTAVLFLMVLMAKNPTLSTRPGARKVLGTLGALSTAVYVLHSIVIDCYERFLLGGFAGNPAEPWLRPLAVLAVTLVWAMAWVLVENLLKKRKK